MAAGESAMGVGLEWRKRLGESNRSRFWHNQQLLGDRNVRRDGAIGAIQGWRDVSLDYLFRRTRQRSNQQAPCSRRTRGDPKLSRSQNAGPFDSVDEILPREPAIHANADSW